ncbi:MAG TPA: carboxymuconolactone decarboxylase family protein [Steroidobacteraceae bacterium]|nr:carboxymuconolactone decarboxylase family protein [Steroidobacteraceae bacterium]
MTTLETLREEIPDYAKDLRLNLGSVLAPGGAPGLTDRQIWMVAVATAIASRNALFAHRIEALAHATLDAPALAAAKAAAAIMGMNNIYYRFAHLTDDTDYRAMPARLRMNVIASPGIDKADFELLSLAVSAVNGCGLCLNAHDAVLKKHGVSREAIQSAVRIGSVIHAVAGVLAYEAAA